MMKRIVRAGVLAALALIVVTSCTFAPMEIWGTWTMAGGGVTESLEFCLSKFTITDIGSFTGTWECSYEDIDQGANHILLETTRVTGNYVGWFSTGERMYMTYAISGDTMYIGLSNSGYPTTTPIGAYYKE